MEETKIHLWKTLRSQILKIIYNKDLEKLFKIPDGLSNNLIWIFGHLVRSRDFLLLKIANFKMNFPEKLDPLFAKNSSPKNWQWQGNRLLLTDGSTLSKEELLKEILSFEEQEFIFLLEFITKTSSKNEYLEKNPYETSMGFVIDSLEKAFEYNLMHESIHLGQIQVYNKLT